MISDFLASWPLFRDAYLAGWFFAMALSLWGVFLLLREQIFFGAALSQASALGVATGFPLAALLDLGHAGRELLLYVLAAFFAGGAALFMTAVSEARDRSGRHGYESATGWVFLAAAGTAVLLASGAPFALEEVEQMLHGGVIGSGPEDALLAAAVFLLSALALALWGRRFALATIDADFAAAAGLRGRLTRFALSLCIALAAGLSIRYAGLLYSFAALILPALALRRLVPDLRTLFLLAPLAALFATTCGFILAHAADWPLAHTAVTCLAALAAAGSLLGRLRAS